MGFASLARVGECGTRSGSFYPTTFPRTGSPVPGEGDRREVGWVVVDSGHR